MKKYFVSIMLLVAWALTAGAQQQLPQRPNVGNARIIVLANNLENFYYNYDESSRPSYDTDAGRAAKTNKIVQMMISSGADIFAFCEVEAKPITLEYLVQELNTAAGGDYYAAVSDGINVTSDSYDNAIKSGFVYRKATVKPYGSNYAATNITYYKNTMRIQAWEELSTGERFTLSMNHFKASSDDASKQKRVDNANWLIGGLNNSSKVKDPDILIMGDLNAQMAEEAMQIIVNNGYEEQLLRYDEDAYSYIYKGTHELIDHAFANSTMAEQITGAVVWHTNTSASYSNRYSDHDAVLVGLRLGEEEIDPSGLDQTTVSVPCRKEIRHGQIVIIRGDAVYTVIGQKVIGR